MLTVTEKKLTGSLKRAKILADNRKSHHPIETLLTWLTVKNADNTNRKKASKYYRRPPVFGIARYSCKHRALLFHWREAREDLKRAVSSSSVSIRVYFFLAFAVLVLIIFPVVIYYQAVK